MLFNSWWKMKSLPLVDQVCRRAANLREMTGFDQHTRHEVALAAD